jgi:hypothetical protein
MSISSVQPGDPVARAPRNKGRLVGQKPPLKLQEIWAIPIRLQLGKRLRDLIGSWQLGRLRWYRHSRLRPSLSTARGISAVCILG